MEAEENGAASSGSSLPFGSYKFSREAGFGTLKRLSSAKDKEVKINKTLNTYCMHRLLCITLTLK